MSRKITTLILLLVSAVFTTGFSVQPMVFELDASGSKSRTTLTIQNDSGSALSLEFIPEVLSIDDEGKETRLPADDDLLLFPPVAVVPTGTAQTVQVQYVGDPEIHESVAYRVSVKQVAVDISGNSEGIRIAANFTTLLNVVPIKSAPIINVESITQNSLDPRKWVVTVKNSGNRYARLSHTDWVVRTSGATVQLSANEVARRTESDLMLPNRSRNVLFTPPENLDHEGASIEILLR